ncbi:MAG: anthranilate synthase component I [Planctomycetota bacterium]|nr:anthranilate synthase component I [Planctomycetota bacterium]
MVLPTVDDCVALVADARARGTRGTIVIPIAERLLADQLTPVLAYRRLVAPDERTAPSFLLESVEGGERQGRYSILGARPIIEVIAREHEVRVTHHRAGQSTGRSDSARHASHQGTDPLVVTREISASMTLLTAAAKARAEELPRAFLGGWVGYAAYDSVRYAEPEKLAFERAPRDDRGLADVAFGFYDGVVIFDHVDKIVHVIQLVMVEPDADPRAAHAAAAAKLAARVEDIQRHSKPLPSGKLGRDTRPAPLPSNMTREQHATMINQALEYIRAGDIFQVVLGQRFERASTADPFDVYRALRAVNPSPYMTYMQAPGCILVASSPEILCRVRRKADGFEVTNRPLAGTRRRGATREEDLALERELLADPKERAEHVMLVDLGRNDVGRVAVPGTIRAHPVMEVERYSHVMHISSTVTGTMMPGLDCWDALRAALPVGTISGAPKIRAMQIIDELEPIRRGPYGGGFGYVGLDGQMDIALALRTIVTPTALHQNNTWTYHLQAAGGIVADSQIDDEYMETINKSAALARAIDLAESAFGGA